jgi:lysophospholipase L1-like esterase
VKRLVFSALMIAGVVGFFEAAGAVVYYLRLSPEQRQAAEITLGLRQESYNSVLRYRPHPYFNYVCSPEFSFPDGTRPHHPIGIRATEVSLAEKPAGVVRIVALGGSTTYGVYFRDGADVWTSLVGAGLRVALPHEVEVINAGVPNYSTFEMLGMAAMWLPEFEPDLVLVHTGLNDAFTVGFPDEGGPDNTAFRFSWTHRAMPRLARSAMRRSFFFRTLGMQWLSRNGYEVGDMAGAMQRPIPTPELYRENFKQATGRYFRRNLRTLVALIRSAGAEPVFVEMPLNPAVENTAGEYFDAVTAAVRRNNQIMSEVGGELDVPVVELFDRMRDPELFMDAAHMNQHGMLLKGKLVAEAIVPLVDRVRSEEAGH